MLREAWVMIAVITVVVGVASGNAAVVALGAGVAIACYGAKTWARIALDRVTYDRSVPEDRAFTGERVQAHLRITNRKRLPLPWIDVRDRFPEEMVDDGADEFARAGPVGRLQSDWRTSVGGHQRVSRSVELYCPARGVYEIGPARLRAGDLFGLFSDDRDDDRRTRVIVYPRTVTLDDLGLPARRPYGERRGGLPVFEDPSRVAGVRDYRPGDSLRRIDWSATARSGALQSRVYEPSSSMQLLLCVNVQTLEPAWAGFVPDVLERTIAVAASLARDAYDRRYAIGMLANGTLPEADRAIRIAPGQRPEQYIRVLEALAVITPYVLGPLSAMLDAEEHRIPVGTTIAVMTGVMPQPLVHTLVRLRGRGHRVIVLDTAGGDWAGELAGISVHDVSHIEAPQPVTAAAGAL